MTRVHSTRIKTGDAARSLDRSFGRRGRSSTGVGEVGGGDVNDLAIAEDDQGRALAFLERDEPLAGQFQACDESLGQFVGFRRHGSGI